MVPIIRPILFAFAALTGLCAGGEVATPTPIAKPAGAFIPPPDTDSPYVWKVPSPSPSPTPTPLSPELQFAADLAEVLRLLNPAAEAAPSIAARLELPAAFARGEPIISTIVLRNETAQPQRIELGGDHRTGRSSRIELELQAADGRTIPDPLAVIVASSLVGGIGSEKDLKPGEEHRVPFLLQLFRAPIPPGEYRLRVRYDSRPSFRDGDSGWIEGTFRVGRHPWRGINADVLQLFEAHGIDRDPCIVAGFLPDERRIPELLDKLNASTRADDDEDAPKPDRNKVRSALDALMMMPVESLAPVLFDRIEREWDPEAETEHRLIALVAYSARTAEWRTYLQTIDLAKYPKLRPTIARIGTLCGLPPPAAELKRERFEYAGFQSPTRSHLGALLAYQHRCKTCLREEPQDLRERSDQLLFRIACDPNRQAVIGSVSEHLDGGHGERTWVVVEHALREHIYPFPYLNALLPIYLYVSNGKSSLWQERKPIPDWIRGDVFTALRLRVLLPEYLKDREYALWILACFGDRRGVELLAPRLKRGTESEQLTAIWSLVMVGAIDDLAAAASAIANRSYGEDRFPGRYSAALAARGIITDDAAAYLMKTDDRRLDRNPPSRGVRLMLLETAIARCAKLPEPDWQARAIGAAAGGTKSERE